MLTLLADGKAGEVELEGGDKLPFDYCLLATGSAYAGRFIKPDPSKLVGLSLLCSCAYKIFMVCSVLVGGRLHYLAWMLL